MNKHQSTVKNSGNRAEAALMNVLPGAVDIRAANKSSGADLVVNGQPLNIKWAGKGYLGDIRRVLSGDQHPDVVAAQRMSPGAKAELANAGIAWVDETGAAEIAIGLIVVSRSGFPSQQTREIKRWTPAVLAVTEAILCGVKATVSETAAVTGLSEASCTNALKFLTNQGLLESAERRGPRSARNVKDERVLLDEYVTAVESTELKLSLQVGMVGRDVVSEISKLGTIWDNAGVVWASSGLLAANAMAPLITSVSSAEVYVNAKNMAALNAIASKGGLSPIAGGRLILKPFPTVAVQTMSQEINGLQVAPWPRVYADLLQVGVRGEDAAEHFLEVIRGR